ncbi:hypothetical protein JGS22_020100 [Streptomyces sp. P38-E01]|uniref:Secreted protein n=1 Tax=Streptomyces tardus TaxID=2780544 RepID=A0A949JRD9_9ACTN|nr:hypothetical protein [Streptomyces tardus]MBU7599866.1 hypothetical protein [Streptomyces tardus]
MLPTPVTLLTLETSRVQPSAGQDLPHTRTRPVHWLATAAALAAVVAATVMIQPTDATATSDTGPLAARQKAAAGAPAPEKADYPLDCGPWEAGVVEHGAADFDGDGVAETIAVVRCATEGGTPPSGVFVLARAERAGAPPRVVRTLLDPAERLSVDDFAVRGGVISATLRGYSSQKVPRCCPDQERSVSWRWTDGDFALKAAPTAMGV